MAARDSGRAARRRALAWLAGLGLLVACSSAPQPGKPAPPAPALPPQSVSQATLPPPPPAEQPVALPAPEKTLVVIDAGEAPPATTQNIVEAAKAERERRKDADAPIVILNDKNLAAFAAGQKLTIANPEPGSKAATPAQAAPADPRDEDYWRKRGRELRTQWRDAVDRGAELQRQATQLRDRFYNTDDPAIRDGQVKPLWDRTLEQIRVNQQVVEESQHKVEVYLEEGRRAGALPGWLREGTELEPVTQAPAPSEAKPGEPAIAPEPPPT